MHLFLSKAPLLDRLEAAILARIFRGELVPQGPADEPASVLLERIRATRSTSTAKRARRRKVG
jgi:type I restriction enzyme S subunit